MREVAQQTKSQLYLLHIIRAAWTVRDMLFKKDSLLGQERAFEIVGDQFHDLLADKSLSDRSARLRLLH